MKLSALERAAKARSRAVNAQRSTENEMELDDAELEDEDPLSEEVRVVESSGATS